MIDKTTTTDEAVRSLQEQFGSLRSQNELLKAQLMNTSLINELTKVMHSSTNPSKIVHTVLLGIQEIIEFDRVVLFEIDKPSFRLKPTAWVGLQESEVSGITVPLGFDGGEITDAIFLNRHLVVDEPEPDGDPFAKLLGSTQYLVVPFVSKVTRKCWEVKSCGRLSCPAYGSYNPYCWSIVGAGDGVETMSEDDRRRRCIECPNFKAEGVFWMDRAVSKAPITSDHITTLSTIINQAGIIIENFRIFNALEVAHTNLQEANQKLKVVNEDLRQAQAKINRDLDHARTIQQGLLPHIDAKRMKGFEVGSKYIPADAVGGDYYDVFEISEGVFGIVVADVSGHGVSSALIMSMVKVLLKTFAAEETSPQKTLERINQTFQTEIRTDNFVTLFYAVLDTNELVLRFTSAGHCPTLFLDKQNKTCTQVKADGLFLGAFADMMLEESSTTYEPGAQRIVLYTDGLTEAKNGNEDMFDLTRLEKAALETISIPPDKAIREIMRKQKEFCGNSGVHEDDITLLVIDI